MTAQQQRRLEILNSFLDEHNCKAKFFKYRDDYYTGLNSYQSYSSMVTTHNPANVFSTAFSWADTPEGTQFWSDLADEFKSKFIIQ